MSTIAKFLSKPPDQFSTQIASATVASDALTVTLDSTSGLPTEGVGQFFKKDANGALVSGSVEFVHWTNVAGNTITFTDTGDRGITGSDSGAQSYVADDYFEVWASSYYVGGYGGTVEHGADGTHDNTKVALLAGTQTVTGDKTFSGSTTMSGVLSNTGAVKSSVTALSGTTPNMDLNTKNQFTLTLSGNTTFTVSNETIGQVFLLQITQDSGASGHTITWPSTVHWVDGTAPTQTATASAVDVYGFRVTGTDTYQGYVIGQDLGTV